VRRRPHPGRQRQQPGDPADDPDQRQALTPPVRRDQQGGDGPAGHDGDREPDPAHHADRHDHADVVAEREDERRRAEQDQPDTQRPPVADPDDQPRRHQLGGHGGQQQRDRREARAGGRAGVLREQRHDRERQVEADRRADDRDEPHQQGTGHESGAGRPGEQLSGHVFKGRSQPGHR
jgi:hypothetical protein